MEWHVWGPNDTEPTIFNNSILLQNALSQYSSSDIVIVEVYKVIYSGAQVYNGANKIALPSPPQKVPVSKVVNINHVYLD